MLRIGIDGPAGAGKTTLARRLAGELGIPYIDTGAMYRALTLRVILAGRDPADEEGVVRLAEKTNIVLAPPDKPGGEQVVMMDGVDVTRSIRSPEVNEAVSVVASHPRVRHLMVKAQRAMANGSVVMEGRDICTKVLPEAEMKLFLTAEVEERVRRRLNELREKGFEPSVDEVRAEVERRDRIDSSRAADPLRPAEDSVILDSTGMTADEVTRAVLDLCEDHLRCCTGL